MIFGKIDMPINVTVHRSSPSIENMDAGLGNIRMNTLTGFFGDLSYVGFPRTSWCFLTAVLDGQQQLFPSQRAKFDALAERWNKYNRGRSVVEYNHPAYWQIVGMGPSAIPFLLEDMEKNNGRWFKALRYITGIQMGTEETRGDFQSLKRAWLEWSVADVIGSQLLGSPRGFGRSYQTGPSESPPLLGSGNLD
jgi:hypothetical protein